MYEISNSDKGMFYEMFCETGINPSDTLEGKVASKYHSAQEALERAITDFERKYYGLSDEQVNQLISEDGEITHDIDAAQRTLEKIEFGIADFIDIVESYSREEVYDELHRCESDIKKSRLQAKNIKRKARRDNPTLNLEEIKDLEVVRSANLERDRVISELNPRIDELNLKLRKAMEILMTCSQG
jgi:hypothetical protein